MDPRKPFHVAPHPQPATLSPLWQRNLGLVLSVQMKAFEDDSLSKRTTRHTVLGRVYVILARQQGSGASIAEKAKRCL